MMKQEQKQPPKFILYYGENQKLSQEKIFIEETNTALVVTKTSNPESLVSINPDKVKAVVIDASAGENIHRLTGTLVKSNPEVPVFLLQNSKNINVPFEQVIVLDKSAISMREIFNEISGFLHTENQEFVWMEDYAGKRVRKNHILINNTEKGTYQGLFAFKMTKLLDDHPVEIDKWARSLMNVLASEAKGLKLQRLILSEKNQVSVYFVFQITAESISLVHAEYERLFPLISYYMNENSLINPAHFTTVYRPGKMKNIKNWMDNNFKAKAFVFQPRSLRFNARKKISGYTTATESTPVSVEIPAVLKAMPNEFDELFNLFYTDKNSCLVTEIEAFQAGQSQKENYNISVEKLIERNLSAEEINAYRQKIKALSTQPYLYRVKHTLFTTGNIAHIINQNISKTLFDNQNEVIALNGEQKPQADHNFVQTLDELGRMNLIPVISKGISFSYGILNEQEKYLNPLFLDDSGIHLGQHYLGNVYLDPKQFKKHTYLLGKTGTGKTSLLYSMIMDRIERGEGVALIDPHGDLYKKISENIPFNRFTDVIKYNPSSPFNMFGFNMLHYNKKFPLQQNFILDQFFEFFNERYDMKVVAGPMFELYFTSAMKMVMEVEEDAVLQDFNRFFFDDLYRKRIMIQSKNDTAKRTIKNAEKAHGEQSFENFAPYITSKVNRIIENDYIRNTTCVRGLTYDFRKMIDKKKIFLVHLNKGKMGSEAVNLLGRLLTNQILMAAYSREDIPENERIDFSLFIDEFQNFTGENIVTALSETRKYHLQLILANQTFEQLEPHLIGSILGNVGSVVTAAVSPMDAKMIEPFFEPFFTRDELVQMDNYKFIVSSMYNNRFIKPFIVTSIPY